MLALVRSSECPGEAGVVCSAGPAEGEGAGATNHLAGGDYRVVRYLCV